MSTIFFSEAPFSTKTPSSEEMRLCDQSTISSGISEETLVNRAGKAIFEKICSVSALDPGRDHIAIFCGPGNNGADGFVIARHFLEDSFAVHLYFPTYEKVSPACQKQADSFVASGGKLLRNEPDLVKAGLKRSRVIIDALLGVGQKDTPRGDIDSFLQAIKAETATGMKRIFVAVDVPTGVSADTGEVFDSHFRADYSVCVELVKRGMLQHPGREACGDIHAVSIGIDCGQDIEFSVYDASRERPLEPRRADSHKGKFGAVLVIGGSASMPGAPLLSALAALRCGAGLVKKAQLKSMREERGYPELVLSPLSADTHFKESCLAELKGDLEKADCVILGPGLGLHPDTSNFVNVLCEYCTHNLLPVVVDADALTLIAPRMKAQAGSFPSAILTPHPGEMATLLGQDVPAVQKDRYRAARSAQEQSGGVIVLKGAGSISCFEKNGFVNLSGNPFMATPGSGDVLTGVIASLVAQGLSMEVAAPAGVWIHGKAGDLAHERTRGPIIASDIVNALPEALAYSYKL